MTEPLPLCDQPNCLQPAHSFSFQDNLKIKACLEHLSIHSSQPRFDITVFSSVASVEEGLLHLQRRDLMQTGLKNIQMLEMKLEKEWNEAGKWLHHSENDCQREVFIEREKRFAQRYETVKKRINQRCANLNMLVTDLRFELNPDDLLLCKEELVDIPADLALELLPEGSNQMEKEASIELQGMEKAYTNEDICRMAEQHLKAGVAAQQLNAYDQSLKELQQGRALLQQRGLENPELCLHLGHVLSHFGNTREAENTLLSGVNHILALDPKSQLVLRLQIELAETYYQAGEWDPTVEICDTVLNNWSGHGYYTELLRVLYYLVTAYYYLGNRSKAGDLVEKWTEELRPRTSLGKCLRLIIREEKLRREGTVRKVKYEEVCMLAQSLMPFTYITACSRYWFGRIYHDYSTPQVALTQYTKASNIFSTHFPFSYHYAYNLVHLARACRDNGDYALSIDHLITALGIFSTRFPLSQDYSKCLANLGDMYNAQDDWIHAQEHYLHAKQLFEINSPKSLSFVSFLKHFGEMCGRNNWKLAEEVLLQACSILETDYPWNEETANSADALAGLYKKTQRWELAEKYSLRACFYSGTSSFLHKAAIRYVSEKKMNAAEIVCEKACAGKATPGEITSYDDYLETLRSLYDVDH